MAAPKEVLDLVERFERNREAYRSGQYNEMQLRQEFLDPFFAALGWDMNNQQGYAEAYKDVIHEDSIKVGADTKAPDYCFRIGGTRKFFLEAKKPSVYIKEDISPAFQLRRYAWSAKLPLSILTDFEEFAVYDARIKPEKTDKASNARIHYFTYKEYEKQWDLISSVFSREAVLKGSFDKYAEKSRLKKGTATVDDAFLTEIEDWRDMLAKNIALRNADLTTRELNFCVQRTIDRIVFLRICEDRGIEEYGRLQTQLNGTNVYKRLVQLFSQADDRYNSGLFHFQREKDRHEEPDKLTPNISIDDKPLKDIINRLYYPESPYEFSVLSADILGQVYEQFLGKVIRLTAGHQAKVEEKPEVRKAGGVYYTPKYIVDYIVKNTVGALLTDPPLKKGGTGGFDSSVGNPPQSPFAKGGNKITPKEVSKLKILDPACGSGSFLLGAYQYLLDWHRDWYANDDPKKWATSKNPTLYQAQGGDYHLTTSEKKRILLNNIYGVDIDSQAVEVTKLSLLLKVLEGENNQTLANQLRMFHERALPDLGDNIKCGNSLIGPAFYQQQTMLDDEERYRVNVFDWEKEFSEITKVGGFDAVIGNPPYGASFSIVEKTYLSGHFDSIVGKYDSYGFFIEKGLLLLRAAGVLGFITPHTWLTVIEAEKLREFILKEATINALVRLPTRVFRNATVNTILMFLMKGKASPRKDQTVRALILPRDKDITDISEDIGEVRQFSVDMWANNEARMFNIEITSEEQSLIEKIKGGGVPLTNFCDFCVGIQAYDSHTGQEQSIIEARAYHATIQKNKTFRKELNGNDVSRYEVRWTKGSWISYGPWLAHPRQPHFFEGPRILVREITGSGLHNIHAAFTEDDYINYKTILNVKLQQKSRDEGYHDFYILGLLNSALLSWYFPRASNKVVTKTFPRISILDMKRFIVPPVAFANKSEKARHDKMIFLVDQMLSVNKQLHVAKTDHETTALQRQVDATDHQIDQLVYELYGLTEEEIRIVEGADK
jgi:type I restriction-modification system DNA methylase subunit